MSGGRPSVYTDELAMLICTKIAEGESLRGICRQEEMPAVSTVTSWLVDETKPEFSARYAQARKAQAYLLADELIEIADDGTNDYVTKTNSDGSTYEALDSEHVQRSRLRLDTRKWYLSKVMPKDFGDSTNLKVSGDKENPLQMLVSEISGNVLKPNKDD